MNQNDEPVPTKTASKIVGLSVSTLTKLRLTGGGPRYLRLGRAIRYRRSDLNAWMDASSHTSTSEYPARQTATA